MESLAKICDILRLKRKSLERDIAALDSQIKSIDRQLMEIDSQRTQMTSDVYAQKKSEGLVQNLRWLEEWKGKLIYTIRRLEEIKSDIIAQRQPKQRELSRLIVEEEIMNRQRQAKLKIQADLRTESQTSERLETWVNTHIS